MRQVTLAAACGILALAWGVLDRGAPSAAAEPQRRMSFHNRLLLNRAAVSGIASIEVMLLASEPSDAHVREISTRAPRLGGRVRKVIGELGYLRIEVPTDRLLDLVAPSDVAAYQIASLSRGQWYRDTAPMANAEMYRGFEAAPPRVTPPDPPAAALPALSSAASRHPGYTGADDTGVAEWVRAHPTFDGRGVTIAMLESAQPSFPDPTLGSALSLDGRPVPKLAGILNTIDPDQPDATRVVLGTAVRADTAWVPIEGRTYVLPRAGHYSFGLFTVGAGAHLVHRFGVLRDEETGGVWLDTDGDADFQNEKPLADVNERVQPAMLLLRHPHKLAVPFVMGAGATPDVVHIYAAFGSHQAMTASVAAGSTSETGLASGVAPNARVLLVRNMSAGFRLADFVESYLAALARTDVDIVNASNAFLSVPDTASDFIGLVLQRAMARYDKPVIDAAGNQQLWLSSAAARGPVMTAGGTMGPQTFAALYGGAILDGPVVHPAGAAGPSLDGAIKPDFIAPMERLAADLPWNTGVSALPMNAPVHRVPPGYQISCCSSASSPYAAGIAALLISGARQTGVPYSLASLARAMRIGARFLPGHQSHEQGNGVLDVNAAWRELTTPLEIPRIVASAHVVHPLAQYAAQGSRGQGILEHGGWTVGMTATREIRFRRDSGPAAPVTYSLSWTGSDGSFTTPPTVTLPQGVDVAVPVTIRPVRPGARSALLNLHDAASGRIVFRTQATIAVPEPVDPSSGSARFGGSVALMKTVGHYVEVPDGTSAIGFELVVSSGVVRAAIVPGHGLYPSYYHHVHPGVTRPFPPGTYQITLPYPEAGPWAIYLTNDTLTLPRGVVENSSGRTAQYAVTVRLRSAAISVTKSDPAALDLQVTNVGSAVREPAIALSSGLSQLRTGDVLATGLPTLFDIQVPADALTLALRLNATAASGDTLELHLYDCTSGECFSYDLAFPAAPAQTLVVRHPRAGRWIAAVNAAPFPTRPGSFNLEQVIATGAARTVALRNGPIAPRGRLRTRLADVAGSVADVPGETPVVLVELLDLAVEREEAARSWDPRAAAAGFRSQPIAIGTAVHSVK